jgi:hypothetical protein
MQISLVPTWKINQDLTYTLPVIVGIHSVLQPETRPDLSPETSVSELPFWTGYQLALAVP